MTVFGELFGGDQIDAALIDVLRTWMPTYLKEIARQRGLDAPLEAPRSYTVVSEFDTWPETQTPAVVIVNPGTTGTPAKNGAGAYTAQWPIEICIKVSAATEDEARRNAQLYIVAARGCIMQRRSLGHGMKSTDWGGENYNLIDVEKRRSMAGSNASFVVEREDVITVGLGPSTPDDPTQPTDWPTVQEAEATVEKKAL